MKISLNVKLGFIAGIVNCLAWYLISKYFDYYSLKVDQYRYFVTLTLLVIGVFISIFIHRKDLNGFIEFKVAAKTGILYTLILSIILSIFNYVYYHFIVPDAISYFISEARKSMEEAKLTPIEIAKHLEVIDSYFGSFRMLMSTIILGVILSLLIGALLRKKNPTVIIGAN